MLDSPYPVCVYLLQRGSTALGLACKNGHASIVNLLLEKGANINKVQCFIIYCYCDITMMSLANFPFQVVNVEASIATY